MSAYTEDDVQRLAGVLDAARQTGIFHGSYTLARWVLDRWPVEGSTPLDSPLPPMPEEYYAPDATPLDSPPAGEVVSVQPPADEILERVEARLRRHFHGADGYAAKGHAASAEDCTPCYEAAEVVSGMVDEARAADEPAPVPPPVDALRCFEHDFSVVAEHTEGDVTVCLGCGERGDEQTADRLSEVLEALATIRDSYAYGADNFDPEHWDETVDKLRALWAAGVEEGRRESRAQTDSILENVIVDQTRAAELLREYFHPDDGDALDGHVRSADGECSVCTDMLAAARRAHAEAYELGVAEGRRQATEERAPEPEHGEVTLKGCLGVSPSHGRGDLHWWRCSTPWCAGHVCDARTVDHG
jgi:hypothetical protein